MKTRFGQVKFKSQQEILEQLASGKGIEKYDFSSRMVAKKHIDKVNFFEYMHNVKPGLTRGFLMFGYTFESFSAYNRVVNSIKNDLEP